MPTHVKLRKEDQDLIDQLMKESGLPASVIIHFALAHMPPLPTPPPHQAQSK